MFDYSPAPKPQHKRIKLTQKQRGDISPSVREEVKERSGNVCERCSMARATDMAHITRRWKLDHKTTADDLLHLCKSCHVWADNTAQGRQWLEEQVKLPFTDWIEDE